MQRMSIARTPFGPGFCAALILTDRDWRDDLKKLLESAV
jgi:hypothetical protein